MQKRLFVVSHIDEHRVERRQHFFDTPVVDVAYRILLCDLVFAELLKTTILQQCDFYFLLSYINDKFALHD